MKHLLFIVISILSLSGYSQKDDFDKNIEKMLKIQGVEKNWETVIVKMIELQKKANPEIDSTFWNMFEDQLLDNAFVQLYELLVPIYKKYLTIEEVKSIINFYESDAGRSLIEKTPLILQETMDIGAKFGGELGRQIAMEIEKNKNNNMLRNFDGCESIKTGKFKNILQDSSIMIIQRDEKYQYEYYQNTTTKYKINWEDDCKYTLEILKTDNEYLKPSKGQILTVNVYEVTDNYYKYVCSFGESEAIIEGIIYKSK